MMLNGLVEQYEQRVREAGEKFGTHAQAGLHRVLTRLDAIKDAIEAERFTEARIPFDITLTADTEERLQALPTASEWLLSSVVCLGACTITMNEDGRAVFAKQFTAADTIAPNLQLRGGADLSIVATGNAAPVRVVFHLTRRTPASPKAASSGMRSPEPLGGTPPPEPGRHGSVSAMAPSLNGR